MDALDIFIHQQYPNRVNVTAAVFSYERVRELLMAYAKSFQQSFLVYEEVSDQYGTEKVIAVSLNEATAKSIAALPNQRRRRVQEVKFQ